MQVTFSKPFMDEREVEAVVEVLRSGMLAQGPKVKELEQRFATYCGTEFAIAVNSGTAGLHCALHSLGISPGDEVITTPFTFVASANAILMAGARVVFADIDEKDFNIDPVDVEKKITDRTKCILPVDLYGKLYSEDIQKIAIDHGLKIVEDACQAVGAEKIQKKAGAWGDAGVFSLYATKNIMCGEGGMIVTNDPVVNVKCREFRHHGQSETVRYSYSGLGYNYRLTDLQAAIALRQLERLDFITHRRNEIACLFNEGLSGIQGLITPMPSKEGETQSFHQYTIRIKEDFVSSRDALKEFLQAQGIQTGIYYPVPLHLQPYFKSIGYKEGDFPVTEKISREVLSLPVHPSLKDEEVHFVIDTIKKYVS